MQIRLPKVLVVNGLFDSYRNICKIEATDGTDKDKLKPLRACMKAIDENKENAETKEDGTLNSWLKTLEFLHTELIKEVKAVSGVDAPVLPVAWISSAWESVKDLTYKEKSRDRMLKTIAAAKANIARPLFEQIDVLKETKDGDKSEVGIFQKERLADYNKIDVLEDEIRQLKKQCIKKTGQQNDEAGITAIKTLNRAIATKIEARNKLIVKYVQYNDPDALVLAAEAGLLHEYRTLPGFSSEYCPSYLLLNADKYFFEHHILVDDHRGLSELSLHEFSENMISGARAKPIVPNPSSTADMSADEKEKARLAEEKHVAEEKEKARLAEEKHVAEEKEKARLAEEKRIAAAAKSPHSASGAGGTTLDLAKRGVASAPVPDVNADAKAKAAPKAETPTDAKAKKGTKKKLQTQKLKEQLKMFKAAAAPSGSAPIAANATVEAEHDFDVINHESAPQAALRQ